MKKNFKKVSALTLAMALTAASSMPTFAAKHAVYDGEITGGALTIDMDLPSDGTLSIKPYAGTQISTEPLYFHNKNAEPATGEDNITYTVGLAGYTCVVKSASTDNPVKVAATLPAPPSTAKTITANIELGTATDAAISPAGATFTSAEAASFKKNFGTPSTLKVEKTSEASYDGTAASAYTKAVTPVAVDVAPSKYVPFRIIGTMNTDAAWAEGDGATIVPVFSIGVEVTQQP